jgi:hypothetical protein
MLGVVAPQIKGNAQAIGFFVLAESWSFNFFASLKHCPVARRWTRNIVTPTRLRKPDI